MIRDLLLVGKGFQGFRSAITVARMMILADCEDALQRVDSFLRRSVPDAEALQHATEFPPTVWRGLGESGLLGLSLPTEFGGLGGNYRALAVTAHRMTEISGVMGLTTTWMAHTIAARLHILGKGNEAQRHQWLARLASGESSVSIAISEPGAGAHPKYLSTTAVRDGNDFVINGQKSYLTNGPLCNLFVVLAITGEEDGRKSFSAILVPRDAPGFKQTPGIEIDFLKPSQHCGIELVDCRVSCNNVLGQLNAGFEEISLPMRALEDALMTAKLAGGFAAQTRFLGNQMHTGSTSLQPAPPQEDWQTFGQLLDRSRVLDAIAAQLATELDRDEGEPERLNPISAGFRGLCGDLQADIDSFVANRGVVLSPLMCRLRYDSVKTLGIAQSAHRIQAAKRARAFAAGRGTT